MQKPKSYFAHCNRLDRNVRITETNTFARGGETTIEFDPRFDCESTGDCDQKNCIAFNWAVPKEEKKKYWT